MFELTIITGPDKGQIFRSKDDESVIGRDTDVRISLSDRSASRRHARILRKDRGYELEDLGSGNGTFVNAERVTGAKALFEGDLVMIGKCTMRFHQQEELRSSATHIGGDYMTDATITMRDLQRELAAQRLAATDWDELHRARQDMAAVFRVSQTLNGLQSAEELYPRIIDCVLSELPRADRCSLLLGEGEGNEPHVQITQARKNTIGITDTLYRHSLARIAMQQQQAMLIRDPVNDERFQSVDTIVTRNIRSAICVPVQTQVGLRGVIYADCVTDSAGFDEPDLKLLSIIGLQAAAAVDNARLFEKLREEKSALAAANARLTTAQSQLLQSEKLAGVGQLAAGIVHDIRNPIQIIMGHAQFMLGILAEQNIATCDHKEFFDGLKEIEGGATHVNEIIKQLLAFSRQGQLELRPMRLSEIGEETLRFMQASISKARVKVETHFDGSTPPTLVDAGQIKQVIINVVMNALQAMPNGGTLTVSSGQLSEDGQDLVSLAIADSGVGMTPEQRNRVFDPFFTTKAGNGGTGLGLSVSYGIIENHGGRILVDSEPGKGSCFTLLLPVHHESLSTRAGAADDTVHG